jgi:general secretion pathway protein H
VVRHTIGVDPHCRQHQIMSDKAACRRNGGFTLLETLVVLGILGLALSLILSYGPPASGGLRLRQMADEIAGGLREARSLAIADNRMVSVTFDLAARRWRIDNRPDKPLPEGIEIRLLSIAGENTGSNRGSIDFLPDGSATGGRIEFLGANRHLQIGIDWLSGRVSRNDGP